MINPNVIVAPKVMTVMVSWMERSARCGRKEKRAAHNADNAETKTINIDVTQKGETVVHDEQEKTK
jgi:hypothetical protein